MEIQSLTEVLEGRRKKNVIRKLTLNGDLLLKHKYGISKEILVFLKQTWKDDENKF